MLSLNLRCKIQEVHRSLNFKVKNMLLSVAFFTRHRKNVGFHYVTGTPKLTKKCDMKNMCKVNEHISVLKWIRGLKSNFWQVNTSIFSMQYEICNKIVICWCVSILNSNVHDVTFGVPQILLHRDIEFCLWFSYKPIRQVFSLLF